MAEGELRAVGGGTEVLSRLADEGGWECWVQPGFGGGILVIVERDGVELTAQADTLREAAEEIQQLVRRAA